MGHIQSPLARCVLPDRHHNVAEHFGVPADAAVHDEESLTLTRRRTASSSRTNASATRRPTRLPTGYPEHLDASARGAFFALISVDPEELNRFLFNEDTVDKVLAHADDRGLQGRRRRPARQDHRLRQEHTLTPSSSSSASTSQYPEYGGHFARVITYQHEHAQSLIDDFSDQGQGAAHRDLRRHARHRHRRARGRQPRLRQAGPVDVEVLADDRPRHPPVPGPVRSGPGQDGLLHLRLLRQPRVLQPGPARLGGLAAEVADPAALRVAVGPGRRPRRCRGRAGADGSRLRAPPGCTRSSPA